MVDRLTFRLVDTHLGPKRPQSPGHAAPPPKEGDSRTRIPIILPDQGPPAVVEPKETTTRRPDIKS